MVANKGDLAVLHNRNKMVNAFANTEWVSGSGGAIISRSVTSCAGMTACLVLLAQTRVGFLSGGRGKSFHQLPPQEQAAQREEAYARATVALTRAQEICFIMGPLDMRGLVGASTIIGCLKYGACFSGLDEQEDPVFLVRLKDDDLVEVRPFCKAYDSPARESLECILHWPWLRPSLLRKTMPQGCEGCTSWLWTYTGADGWLTGC